MRGVLSLPPFRASGLPACSSCSRPREHGAPDGRLRRGGPSPGGGPPAEESGCCCCSLSSRCRSPGLGLAGRTMGASRAGPAAVVGLLLAALAALWAGAGAGCAEEGRCCPGRDPTCVSTGWRLSRDYGTCFCDEACAATGDCCYDYAQACPALPCIVGEWTQWSGCAEQCTPNFRMRTRVIQQEPKNGGDPCPPLEEKAGCLEYTTYQGQDCADEYVPAFITTSEYSRERKIRAVHPRLSSETEDSRGYCVEFRTETLSPHCSVESRPYARWMQYLREGYTVCVTCQPPAMHTSRHRCSGDGGEADGANRFLVLAKPFF